MKRLVFVMLATACVPDVDVDESLLGQPRILAVRATPAEAAPGATVSFEALYASESGAITTAPIDWAFCVDRRPLAELGPYAPTCVAWDGEGLLPIGVGTAVSGTVPRDACRLFGPDPPPAEEGEPNGRPADPDVTGGYRIPLRLIEPDDDAIAMAELRITCGVAGATQIVAAELRRRYRANASPSFETLEVVRRDGSRAPVGADPIAVTVGETIELSGALPSCIEADVCGDGLCGIDEERATCADDCGAGAVSGCAGRERYLRYDGETRAIVTEREAMRAAWYATSGTLAFERTGLASDDAPAPLSNTWTAPEAPGPANIVVVLRDGRGAAAWHTVAIAVE